MIFNSEFFIAIIWISLFVNILLMLLLILRKLIKEDRKEKDHKRLPQVLSIITGKTKKWRYGKGIESYRQFKQNVLIEKNERALFEGAISKGKQEKQFIAKLRSWSKINRIAASVELATIPTERARLALEKALIAEKDFSVKLYIANALSDIGDKRSLPTLVESLVNSHYWYRNKVNVLICSFEDSFLEFFREISRKQDIEIKDLIVEFSSNYVGDEIKEYLLHSVNEYENELRKMGGNVDREAKKACHSCVYGKQMLENGDRFCKYQGVVDPAYLCRKYKVFPSGFQQISSYKRMIYNTVEVLSKNYYKELDNERFYAHHDIIIRNIAVEALHNYNSQDKFNLLMDFLGEIDVSESASKGIRKVLSRTPSLVKAVYTRALVEEKKDIHDKLIEILSNKIEYLIMKLIHGQRESAKGLLKEIIEHGKTSQFIWFMNNNNDAKIESELIEIVKQSVFDKPETESVFLRYLDKRLAEACGLTNPVVAETERVENRDKNFIRIMGALVVTIVFAFPLIYLTVNWEDLFKYDYSYHLRHFILDFNYLLIYYSLSLNSVFIYLLILSFFGSELQLRLWNLKNVTMLFKNKMLPTVSIIAPAHNEESTILESVNSLLNLKYPKYELIVVNDGSKDSTMETLVRNFKLERVDFHYVPRLNTMPIRGIYLNPSQPKLIVVDKENGGKADALNAGINIAKFEYFCGIDADSLLEEESLLKLASLTLDESVEIPALGGTVLPINGCSVDKGMITDINIPNKRTARLQTVEYVRSFMTGRLGWASINCVLIISGAFGLFRKERVVGIGGYLTSKEKYGKDTVGEDMEMVVRTRRLMYEMKLKHKVCYAFDANCWTQVPEDNQSLKAQRQRWGRGLADTMTFHRKLLFNPRYGRLGMLAMPFFFVFELAGPIIEIEGYLMVLIAFLFGYLNTQIALMLFITTVLLGVFVSMSAFLILGKSSVKFKTGDILKLMLYGIIENFGPRQIASFWRAGAIFKLLRGQNKWEKTKRYNFRSTGKKGRKSS